MVKIEETLAKTVVALTTDCGLAHGPSVEATGRPHLKRIWPRNMAKTSGPSWWIGEQNLGHMKLNNLHFVSNSPTLVKNTAKGPRRVDLHRADPEGH